MRERPILFSGPMVRAILEGRKTQTRRVVRPPPGPPGPSHAFRHPSEGWWTFGDNSGRTWRCPYGVPGDRLWVRETWRPTIAHSHGMNSCDCDDLAVRYHADGAERFWPGEHKDIPTEWCLPEAARRGFVPSIHMPRWASRLTLEVTGVRVERLQDISEEDARAEGITSVPFRPDDGFPVCEGFMVGKDDGKTPLFAKARDAFFSLWTSINGEESLNANPWVWAVEFRRVEAKERAA